MENENIMCLTKPTELNYHYQETVTWFIDLRVMNVCGLHGF